MIIDPELAAFLEDGLGLHIGTRDRQLQPHGARVTAVNVEPDGTHLWAYVPEAASSRVLPDLQATGPAAVVGARPTDDRACQVKGVFVEARPATPGERHGLVAQWDRFLANLDRIGIPRAALAGWSVWPSIAVRIRVTALFDQTPGPAAGAPLGPAGERIRSVDPARDRSLDSAQGASPTLPQDRSLDSARGTANVSTRACAPAGAGAAPAPGRLTIPLESLTTCFQGLLPAQLYTCSRDGIPNAAYLSHVDYVDSRHVALSFQFFNKSRRNITENPHALVIVQDPDTGQGWCLRLQYVRSETTGPLFDRMALRIEAIASYCGLKGIFKLRAADVYEVLSVEPAAEETGRTVEGVPGPRAFAPDPVFTIKALQDLSGRIQRADSLETLVDSILEGLDESFGFRHSMILVPSEDERVLVAIATRGYPHSGVGAEVRIGEGICGMVAEARKPIRISGLMRGLLYALASRSEPGAAGPLQAPAGRIPLPGLPNPESQLGVPLLVRGELIGVLCLESEMRYRFHEEDKQTIELLGSYVAVAIQNMQLQERAAETPAEGAALAAKPSAPRDSHALQPGARRRRELVYYTADECILLDGEYLIRSLPARILWRLLTAREATGREEFTNRELRLDKSLNLPQWKDNLESRLLLLRRRLEEKCPDIRIVPRCRGRFALEVASDVVLSTRP